MSTVAAFFVFLLIMLSLATLAIILDWMGKPIRRTFRPRTAGTPAWLMAEIPASPDGPAPSPPEPPAGPSPEPLAQPAALVAVSTAGPSLETGAPAADPAAPAPWRAGDSIYKLTPSGAPPSITAVRRRYWKNLSERSSSVVFGEDNRALMSIGEAPQRFNPRTGAIEQLDLSEPMLRYCWATKRRPTPTWGDQGLDPFARP